MAVVNDLYNPAASDSVISSGVDSVGSNREDNSSNRAPNKVRCSITSKGVSHGCRLQKLISNLVDDLYNPTVSDSAISSGVDSTTIAIAGASNKAMINHDRRHLLPRTAYDRKPQAVDIPFSKLRKKEVAGSWRGS
ncbi:hypothetical protein ACLOJK_007590 [Asimina triloba]